MKESRRSNWEKFWDEKKEVREVYSNSDRVVRNLSKITDLKGKKILEVGAGTGRDSFPLVEHGGEVYQLDYSINSLEIMKRLADEEHIPVSIIGGDTFSLPFHDETFDIVFHQGLLEHFRPQAAEALLKENIRILKKGGLLLVDVPQRFHIYTVIKHILIAANKWFAGWEREFSVGELRRDMERLGLETVHAYGEWMYPSLFYRATREALLTTGVKMPLYPTFFKPLTAFRRSVRESLRDTPLVMNTALSFGLVGRKSQ
ncbi:MAG TPA: class I SAM-dependent methyltransferase [Bacteroidota bacterium]|nr:class I SAM-dependent methyltransferase [Bacteroidota bacterium]